MRLERLRVDERLGEGAIGDPKRLHERISHQDGHSACGVRHVRDGVRRERFKRNQSVQVLAPSLEKRTRRAARLARRRTRRDVSFRHVTFAGFIRKSGFRFVRVALDVVQVRRRARDGQGVGEGRADARSLERRRATGVVTRAQSL